MIGLAKSNRLKDIFKIIFILGPPGSGKGVVGNFISKHFNIPTLSCGDLLREASDLSKIDKNDVESLKLATRIREICNKGDIVPAQITIDLMFKQMQKLSSEVSINNNNNNMYKKLFIIDGFPRNLDNYETFQLSAIKTGKAKILHVLYLTCPDDVCYERCAKRAKNNNNNSNSSRREDDVSSVIKERLKKAWQFTGPVYKLLEKQALISEIDSNQHIESMLRDTQMIMEKILKNDDDNEEEEIMENNIYDNNNNNNSRDNHSAKEAKDGYIMDVKIEND